MKSYIEMPASINTLLCVIHDVEQQSDMMGSRATSSPWAILEYTEDFWKTETGKRFEEIARTWEISCHSATVMTSNDLDLFLPFHNEEIYIREGRSPTEEEYITGAAVCLVSYDLAQENSWKIGDQIDISLYESPTFTSYDLGLVTTNNYKPVFVKNSSFFSEQSYQIVGIYDGPAVDDETRTMTINEAGEAEGESYPFYAVKSTVIFVPESSVNNAPENILASRLTTSFRIKNGTTELYLDELEEEGLLMENSDGVRVEITFYDQGYYHADQLTESTGSAAKTIIALAAVTALICVVLFSYLYVSRRRTEMSIMRALGIPGIQIGAALLSCLLLVAVFSVAAGAGLGVLSIDFVEGLFVADEDAQLMNLFSSTYGDGINKSADLVLSRGAAPFVLSAAIILAMAVATVGFMIALELRKSPMMLLSGKGERA